MSFWSVKSMYIGVRLDPHFLLSIHPLSGVLQQFVCYVFLFRLVYEGGNVFISLHLFYLLPLDSLSWFLILVPRVCHFKLMSSCLCFSVHLCHFYCIQFSLSASARLSSS